MGANVKLAEAMGETAKTMGQMNKVMDPQKLAGTMREFEMANAKMSMTEETSECQRQGIDVTNCCVCFLFKITAVFNIVIGI
jgi:hypothetical protein